MIDDKRKAKFFLLFLFFLLTAGLAFFLGSKFLPEKNNLSPQQPAEKEKPVSFSLKEISSYYSVEYPNDFFITNKDLNLFAVANKKWQGEEGNLPEVGIRVYTNVIPQDLSLKKWLEGIGDPNPPVGGEGKSCKAFLDQLRKKIPHHDLGEDNYCWYYGVSDIKETKIAGLDGLEFEASGVSSGSRHTIFTYKNKSQVLILFDIYKTTTGLSIGNEDTTSTAYEMMRKTFKLKED